MAKRSRTPTLRYVSHTTDGGSGGNVSSTAEIFTYTLNRIKPGQLLILAVYSYALVQACKRDWITPSRISKLGAAIVGVLSMVTGLLLSYRFSSALARWEEGKKVWVSLRSDIRDGIRMLSMPIDISLKNASDSPESTSSSSPVHVPKDIEVDNQQPPKSPSKSSSQELMFQRTQELCGLLVGYAFALQHHLHGTRPLPQPPLSDLLPQSYLSSLRRTEARVRFAETQEFQSDSEGEVKSQEGRPGLRRRSTGPKSNEGEEEWELSDLRLKAEEAVEKLSKAVASTGEDLEFRQQLHQLNIPLEEKASSSRRTQATSGKGRKKSNLCAPYPPNMPLALLKLMESYVIGFAEVPKEKGGWAEAKRERGLNLVKSLCVHLGDAERLSSTPPPLPLTVHLTDLLRIYLAAIPPSLMCVASGWTLVCMSVIAGWCFLGLEALISDVGGVFGHSENHHPLPRYASEILHESLDLSPSFMRYYRGRLVTSRGEEDSSVVELDRRNRKGWGEEWTPSFR